MHRYLYHLLLSLTFYSCASESLQKAIQTANVSLLQYALQQPEIKEKIDATFSCPYTDTPLTYACDQKNPSNKIIRLLLEAGANPNQTDRYNNTGLMLITVRAEDQLAKNKQRKIASLLLGHNANPYLHNDRHESAYTFAQELKQNYLIKLFKKSAFHKEDTTLQTCPQPCNIEPLPQDFMADETYVQEFTPITVDQHDTRYQEQKQQRMIEIHEVLHDQAKTIQQFEQKQHNYWKFQTMKAYHHYKFFNNPDLLQSLLLKKLLPEKPGLIHQVSLHFKSEKQFKDIVRNISAQESQTRSIYATLRSPNPDQDALQYKVAEVFHRYQQGDRFPIQYLIFETTKKNTDMIRKIGAILHQLHDFRSTGMNVPDFIQSIARNKEEKVYSAIYFLQRIAKNKRDAAYCDFLLNDEE